MAVSVSDDEWSYTQDITMDTVDIEHLHFLKEGYLHITEEKTDHTPYGIYLSSNSSNGMPGKAAHMTLLNRTSDSAIRGSWKRRWCVLSQTPDGVHLVYYKHQTSFKNCEPPMGVVFMEGCQSLYTIPAHSKSKNTFSISFPNRNILFYTDKDNELQSWLEAFQAALNLQDGSTHSPLKGLPKQKADRKDSFGTTPRPHEQEMTSCDHGDVKRAQSEVATESRDTSSGSKVKVVSYRTLSEVEHNTTESTLTRRNSKPHMESDSKPHVTAELDSEKGPIQFLGFRTLNT